MPTENAPDAPKNAMPVPQSVSAPPPNTTPGDAGMAQGAGKIPGLDQLAPGMLFSDMGSYGLRYFAGYPYEEFLQQLQGRQGVQKYREMLDNSPTVGGIMFAVQSTMRKVEWRVEPANDSGEAQEMADFVESCMQDMSHTWEDLVVENLSMLGYGFAPHEIVYKRRLGKNPGMQDGKRLPGSKYDDGLIGWRRIPLRGQDTVIKWYFDENGSPMGLQQQPWVGGLKDIPIEKMLLFRPSQHKNNPQGRSILRTAYVPYYYVKRLMEQEAIMGERMGGIPVISVPGSLIQAAKAGDPDAVAALNNFKRMATNIRIDEQMGVVLPSDVWPSATGAGTVKQYSLELVTPAGGKGQSMNYGDTIGRYNLSIFTSVLADYLSMGHDARGAQNLGETKVDLFYLAVEGYLNSMGSVYNRYATPRLWALNTLNPDLMPEVKPDLAQRIDLDELSNYVLRLSQAGMPLFPNEDLQRYLADAAGLPDVVDDMALQAAGMTEDQLAREDEQADVMLDNLKNPPEPGNSPLKKMILASVARRQIRLAGPRFGVNTARTPIRIQKRRKYQRLITA